MLHVWGRMTSSNVQPVMWCIAELGLSALRYDVGHKYGGNDTPEFRAMNPNGLVPVLKDGDDGAALWESGAILRYLASRYGAAPFWPRDPMDQATVDKWAEWAKLNVAVNFTVPIFWRLVRTAPRDRDIEAIAAAATTLGRRLEVAEAQLGRHAFLAGDDFTLADIQLAHILFRYFDVAIDRPALPNVRRYYETMTQRPTYRENVMVPYDDLRVHDAG